MSDLRPVESVCRVVVVVCLSVRCSQMTVCEKMKMRLGWAGFGWGAKRLGISENS